MLSDSGYAILKFEERQLVPIEISAMLKVMGQRDSGIRDSTSGPPFQLDSNPRNRNSADDNLAFLKP
jgi:hypothetical protein